jgi:hypothetical protein
MEASLVTKLERERPVLVEDELELEGDIGELVEEVGRLLDVGLAAPGPLLVEPAGETGEDRFLR